MGSNGGESIYVLYKVMNSESDADDSFNAFQMPMGPKGATLATVKKHCSALYGLNHLGPEGYHWRVCVEDKAPGELGEKKFSWWDIQDENASLPVKEATQSQLAKMFNPPKVDHSDIATKAAKGAFKSLGKAVSHAVGHDGIEHGPLVKVVAFKLLDLVRMHDDFAAKHPHGTGSLPQPQPKAPRAPAGRPAQQNGYHHQNVRASAPAAPQQHRPQPPKAQTARPAGAARSQPVAAQEASLMDFGPTTGTGRSAPSSGNRSLHHASSMPASMDGAPSNETRAQRLKREYAQKQQTSKRVWDDVDQRWVEVESSGKSATSSISNSSHTGASQRKEVGISMETAAVNAAGKSANVQAAVQQRVNEMRESQAKALQEVREREERKKKEEAEEDEVRKKLEPRIKAWSEEHGKKKQLRALLASLHTILWPEAKWKQVTIGDLLDDKKVKLAFHKASRVVHPDKTHHLDAEKRFLAKRIFDALSQAKTEFDNSSK